MKFIRKIFYYFFCKKIVYYNVIKREKYNDRNVLEGIIFPYVLAYFNPQKILDIGREDYQVFYNDFFVKRELWTMDIDPDQEEFGMPKKHITDDVINADKHFKDNYFDFILINGVLGWGLNNKENIEKAFSGIYKIMKPGGLLVVGWNDFEDIKVFKPRKISALNKFKPFYFKPLKAKEFHCANGEHRYSFYVK